MFDIGDLIVFTFDEQRRLRITMPEEYLPLAGLRGFLVSTAAEPGLARPEGYPEATRMVTEAEIPGATQKALVDHTYFPQDWSEAEVSEAGEGAWQSAECVRHDATGVWSGLWRGLELAGYYDPETRQAQTYFPVLSP